MEYSRQDSLASFERLVDSMDDFGDESRTDKNSRKTSKRSRTVSTI